MLKFMPSITKNINFMLKLMPFINKTIFCGGGSILSCNSNIITGSLRLWSCLAENLGRIGPISCKFLGSDSTNLDRLRKS